MVYICPKFKTPSFTHSDMFAVYHQTCQPTISSSIVSTSRIADALPLTGSVHLVGQGIPGYNR